MNSTRANSRSWKKQLYKLITLIGLPIAIIPLLAAYPIILLISGAIQLTISILNQQTLQLFKFLLQRLVGLSVIDHYYNNKGKLSKKLLFATTARFLIKETSKRLASLLLGNSFITNIVNNINFIRNSKIDPTKKKQAIFSLALHIITAPLQILWSYPRRIIGACIYKIIMPKGTNFSPRFMINTFPTFNNDLPNHYEGYRVKEYFLATRDGESLETIELIHKGNEAAKPHEIPYVIQFTGAGGVIGKTKTNKIRGGEGTTILKKDLILYGKEEAKGANVILFNNRGIGLSSGCINSTDDLVTDGVTIVKSLLDRGISPDNITLDGYSIGGAISILVAHKLYKQTGIKVNVYADRTLYKLGAFGLYYFDQKTISKKIELSTAIDDKLSIVSKARKTIDASFVGVYLRSLLKWFGCEIHAGKASLKLLQTKKDDTTTLTVVNAKGDGVISEHISLNNYLNDKAIKKQIEKPSKRNPLYLAMYNSSQKSSKNVHFIPKSELFTEADKIQFKEACLRSTTIRSLGASR